MIELLVLGGLLAVGLALVAIVGFVLFLLRLVFWLVLLPFRLLFLPIRLLFLPIRLVFLPFRILFKLVMLPVWLTLGGLGLAVGTVAVPLVIAGIAVVGVLGLVAAILA